MCTLTCQKHVNVPMMATNIFVYILNKDTFCLLLGILTQYLNAVALGKHECLLMSKTHFIFIARQKHCFQRCTVQIFFIVSHHYLTQSKPLCITEWSYIHSQSVFVFLFPKYLIHLNKFF